jgi:hypothetical protein
MTELRYRPARESPPTGARGARRPPAARSIALALGTAVVVALTGCTGAPHADAAVDSGATAPAATAAVASVSPATASVAQQRTVTITGTGLAKVKTVDFGGVPAPVRSVVGAASADGANRITVKAPPAPRYQPATVPITLRDAAGKVIASKKAVYSYTATSAVDKQLQYALTYWQNYNTAQYGDLNPVGGDCANFVSQSLIARGWSMNDQWYNHDAAGDWSPAWGYVPAMNEYFADNADQLGLQQVGFDQRSHVALGDVAIFDWDGDGSPDHVQVVTAIKKVHGVTKIEMASHNDDYDFRDLDNEITVEHPGATGHFWHLTR